MPALRDAPVVLVEEPGRAPLHVVLLEPLEVGRDGPGLLLDDPQVSRHHLELRPESGQVWVRDLGSTHGTTLDGLPVTEPVTLGPESVIRLGNTTIVLAGLRLAESSWQSGTGRPRSSIERVAAEVTAAGAAVRKAFQADRTVTIAFSDIESSTELASSLGDAQWFEVLSVHNAIIRRAV
ncbi:MAG: FHA domain-containing protein, partial [Actinomycetota bacterium]|nr:FHA domain-containing protein [Actinomycetota bacterium]